jgi:hypothetical protein
VLAEIATRMSNDLIVNLPFASHNNLGG